MEGITAAIVAVEGTQNQRVTAAQNKEARDKAKELGFKPVKDPPFDSHGQPVFKKGNRYISPDVDEHKGRAWKVYDNKGRRTGTYDWNLKKRLGK